MPTIVTGETIFDSLHYNSDYNKNYCYNTEQKTKPNVSHDHYHNYRYLLNRHYHSRLPHIITLIIIIITLPEESDDVLLQFGEVGARRLSVNFADEPREA